MFTVFIALLCLVSGYLLAVILRALREFGDMLAKLPQLERPSEPDTLEPEDPDPGFEVPGDWDREFEVQQAAQLRRRPNRRRKAQRLRKARQEARLRANETPAATWHQRILEDDDEQR